jgi:hypothetical protein
MIESRVVTYPDYVGGVKEGRAHADANVVHKLYQRAKGSRFVFGQDPYSRWVWLTRVDPISVTGALMLGEQ